MAAVADLSDIIDLRILPHSVQRLVAIIGLPQTLVLLRARGGTIVHIPATLDSSALVCRVLHRDAVAALIASDLAGVSLQLPKIDKYAAQLRNHAIRQSAGTLSPTAAAIAFGVSRQTIHHIRRSEDDGQQGDFFGGGHD